MPSDRPCQELLNACFSFEIGNCILKLWPLKVCLKTAYFEEKSQGYSLAVLSKLARLRFLI